MLPDYLFFLGFQFLVKLQVFVDLSLVKSLNCIVILEKLASGLFLVLNKKLDDRLLKAVQLFLEAFVVMSIDVEDLHL